MRPADTWKDYELLDATDGNRLERWGETLLIRPDPQVVWKTPKQSPLWAKADAIYHDTKAAFFGGCQSGIHIVRYQHPTQQKFKIGRAHV